MDEPDIAEVYEEEEFNDWTSFIVNVQQLF